MVTLPALALALFWLKASVLPEGVEMSTVEPPPPAPPPPAGVVCVGVAAAVVELSLLLPPQAARPTTASAVTAITAEARLIGSPFSRRSTHSITSDQPLGNCQSPWN